MNENDPKNLAWYVKEYKGAIIGGVVALLCTAIGISQLLLSLVVIAVGIFLGHYIQNHKDTVKETLKEFIDKIF